MIKALSDMSFLCFFLFTKNSIDVLAAVPINNNIFIVYENISCDVL